MDNTNNQELWKPINGYDRYEISNDGRIKNILTKREARGSVTKEGYMRATLTNNGKSKQYLVHNLVAEHYLENEIGCDHILHIDGDKTNNNVSNMKYVSWTDLRNNRMEDRIEMFDIENINSLPGEIWKPITGYEKYFVSNQARIINISRGKFLKPTLSGGYHSINLSKRNERFKMFRVHRLVAIAFVANPDPKTKIYVDHINNNKLDNVHTNLRWVTPRENTKYYFTNYGKDRSKTVLQYKNNKCIREWDSIKNIIKSNPDYKENTFRNYVRQGKKYHGYIWKYKDREEFRKKDGEKFRNLGTIDGYNCSKYSVSNYGRIKRSDRDKIIQPREHPNGYNTVLIYHGKGRKHFFVHYLVATLFVPGKTEERKYVNHINENKRDNASCNLEWCTLKENSDHSTSKKVCKMDPITGKILNTFNSISDAARHIQPDRKSTYDRGISRCCHNKQKQYAGFKWQFADQTQIKTPHPNDEEIWKPIKHYPSYQISNTGKARHTKTKKELHQTIQKDNRYMINLSKNGMRKKFAIHILVAKHFIKDFENDYVFHIDGDKSNNASSNLRIESRKEAKAKLEIKKNAKIKNLEGEVWKEIENFPSYKISNKCRVQNVKTGRLLKQTVKTTRYGDSYKVVMLRKKSGKETTVMMHRLMAETFVKNPNENKYIRHIDGNRCNNKIQNIEWVDHDAIYK